MPTQNTGSAARQDASPIDNWGAVYAMSLCVFALIASEFMPVSLLTPMASDLAISEGQAGQAVSISGLFAVLTSLSISALTRNVDRKVVILALTIAMIVSGAIVAVAPTFEFLMVGRALLGVVIGGFWSMSAAIVMRLVSARSVPRALAVLNGGNALAATVAAPLGSYLGGLISWRGAFFCIVPIAAIALIWQWRSLPAMRNQKHSASLDVLRLLSRTKVWVGMLAVTLLFMGQFSLFTYLRPFLETVTGFEANMVSVVLLVIGVGGVIGTLIVGHILQKTLYAVLFLFPVILAVIALGLIVFGHSTMMTVVLFAGWGVIATAAPVGWWTWLSRTLPDDAETGGGLMVAVIQFAITLGAAIGGYQMDHDGYQVTFSTSAVLLVLAGLAAVWSFWTVRSNQVPTAQRS
ncbi:MFS transporter [Thalassospira sp.]|uniref:MFS transporter n=1 Tax=Thalassospira sp. TaxID=1912094 RepID=UPI0025DBFBA7|nr:MFS transporter [Thalassospira sp.]